MRSSRAIVFLVLFLVSQRLRVAVAEPDPGPLSEDLLAFIRNMALATDPPGQNDLFEIPDELKIYLQSLNNYYNMAGRNRFGKRGKRTRAKLERSKRTRAKLERGKRPEWN